MELNIGEMIKSLRKAQGITQDDLANFLNVSNQSVSKWETGQANPDILYVPKLAEFFGVSIDTLFDCTVKMPAADYKLNLTTQNTLLLDDDINSVVNMWENMHLKYPNDSKVEKELLVALCQTNNFERFDKIFYHTARLLRTNQNYDLQDDALRALKTFLQNIIRPEAKPSKTFKLTKMGSLDITALTDPPKPTQNTLKQIEIDRIFAASQKPGAKAAGKNILIADDAPIMRMLLKHIAEREGFTVVGEAGDGSECVQMARDLDPNIILMDIGMPVKDGLEASREILAEMPDLPIIIISALSRVENVEAAVQIGARDFIDKPFSNDRLIDAINNLF